MSFHWWAATTAQAEIEPPWCGTPEPDAAENLPDGTDPTDPPGSFPHIPYYAIGCTLQSIEDQSDGRMTLEVFEDQSAGGRDMYAVTLNALDTPRPAALVRPPAAPVGARLAQSAARAAADRAP